MDHERTRQRLFPDIRTFFLGFLLPWLAVMVPVSAVIVLASTSLVGAIHDTSTGAARESLVDRRAILGESIQAAKRTAYEIAHNTDVVRMVAASNQALGTGHASPADVLDAVDTYAQRLIREISYYESVFYLNKNGQVVYELGAEELLASVPPASSAYHTTAMRGNVDLSGPYAIGPDRRLVVVATSPTYDQDNRYAGTAGVIIRASRFLEPVIAKRTGSRFSYGVVDENGFILAGNDLAEWTYLPDQSDSAETLTGLILGGQRSSGYMRLSRGQKVLAVAEPAVLRPWTLFAMLPAAQVTGPTLTAVFISVAAALATGIGAGWVILSSRQLNFKNKELADALDELGAAQNLIIQTERSAVLGSAVAGLAHELNTPIGVALTSSSFVRDTVQSYDGGDPAGALAEIGKAADILDGSLRRASAVISSFRRVSVGGGDESPVVLELGQAMEDAVNILSGPLRDADAHPVLTRDVPVYVRTSYAAINRTVASIVAGAAALPSQLGPKLFQIFVSGVDERALVEISLRPLPGINQPSDGPSLATTKRYPGKAIEAGIVKTLVEKDLGGQALVKASSDGGFTVTIRMERAKV